MKPNFTSPISQRLAMHRRKFCFKRKFRFKRWRKFRRRNFRLGKISPTKFSAHNATPPPLSPPPVRSLGLSGGKISNWAFMRAMYSRLSTFWGEATPPLVSAVCPPSNQSAPPPLNWTAAKEKYGRSGRVAISFKCRNRLYHRPRCIIIYNWTWPTLFI